jgi:hypothetical protein
MLAEARGEASLIECQVRLVLAIVEARSRELSKIGEWSEPEAPFNHAVSRSDGEPEMACARGDSAAGCLDAVPDATTPFSRARLTAS